MGTVDVTTAHHDADLARGMEHLRPYVSISSTQTKSYRKSQDHVDEQDGTTYGVPSTMINPPRKIKQRNDSPANLQKRTDPFQFGSRYLEEGDDIFEFNAWDHVETDDAYKEFAELQYQRQKESPASDFDKMRYFSTPSKFWNIFYTHNNTKFFKDRKWLFQEFPSLAAATSTTSPAVTILELGAGAGNTAFPILAANQNPRLKLHACDYAPKAVELIRKSPSYDDRYIQAYVWDVTSVELPLELSADSVDIVIMVFIFSALEPAQWDQAIRNIYRVLKPGGEVLFRDYGRGDLAQVRFKKGRWLAENFYARGDGTRVYFFEKEELAALWSGRSANQNICNREEQSATASSTSLEQEAGSGHVEEQSERPQFKILDLGVDRRMLVNRQRKLKMYRCWIQGRFRKPSLSDTTS